MKPIVFFFSADILQSQLRKLLDTSRNGGIGSFQSVQLNFNLDEFGKALTDLFLSRDTHEEEVPVGLKRVALVSLQPDLVHLPKEHPTHLVLAKLPEDGSDENQAFLDFCHAMMNLLDVHQIEIRLRDSDRSYFWVADPVTEREVGRVHDRT